MNYIFLFLIICASTLVAQPSGGVELLSHKNIPHGTSPQGTYFSACWGWVSPTGDEYAFIGNYDGMSIFSM
ncbi:MAG: hypothetical protein AAB071_05215, partial [Bacteroidota bacterium]